MTLAFSGFVPSFLKRLIALIIAPAGNPAMLWAIIPLIVTVIVMGFYFAAHRHEELGWGSAVANSLVLIFVATDLFRLIFLEKGVEKNSMPVALLVASFIALEGIVLLIINYSHALGKFLSFTISSFISINLTAYLAIVLVYGKVPLDLMTILATMFLFICLAIMFGLLKLFVKPQI